MPSKKRLVLLSLSFFLISLFLPISVLADSDISVLVYDPEKYTEELFFELNFSTDSEGNTQTTVINVPTVRAGENQELGTIRISGKADINVPLFPGQKIRILMPPGIAYMQTPNENNYRNYIEWPESFDNKRNQIVDTEHEPGIKFVNATARSLTIEINNIDTTAEIMLFDFVFNKDDYSKVCLAPFFVDSKEYLQEADESLKRSEFFEQIERLLLVFSISSLMKTKADKNISYNDINEGDYHYYSPLIQSGYIKGYPDQELKNNENITRAEAISLVGRILDSNEKPAQFNDEVPEWAVRDINNAVAHRIIKGYPDGTIRAEQELSKFEALIILQNTLEVIGR